MILFLLKAIFAVVFVNALVRCGGDALASNKLFQEHMERKYGDKGE